MLFGRGSFDNVHGERVRGIALISSGCASESQPLATSPSRTSVHAQFFWFEEL
jgi:hypothetical protein